MVVPPTVLVAARAGAVVMCNPGADCHSWPQRNQAATNGEMREMHIRQVHRQQQQPDTKACIHCTCKTQNMSL